MGLAIDGLPGANFADSHICCWQYGTDLDSDHALLLLQFDPQVS